MNQTDLDNTLNFKKELFYYLKSWKWFVTSLILCSIITFIYLNKTQVIYQSTAKIQIIEDSEGAASFLLGQNNFGGETNSIENDLVVLKSIRILERLVDELDLQTSFYEDDDNNLIWGNQIPFTFEWSNKLQNEVEIIISPEQIDGKHGFVLLYNDQEYELSQSQALITSDFKISISNKLLVERKESSYIIKRETKNKILEQLDKSIEASQPSLTSENVNLTTRGANSKKNNDILNALISIFEEDRINDKREVYRITVNFINRRLELVANTLDSIEKNSTEYKESNVLFNSITQTQSAFNDLSKLNDDSFNLTLQKDIANSLVNNINTEKPFILLPTNLGISNTDVNDLVLKYNTLVTERDQLLFSSTENNPLVLAITSQLFDFKQNILLSLENYIRFLDNSLEKYGTLDRNAKRKLSNISIKESELKGISRNFEISQSLYMDLLQKREDATIKYEGVLSNVKIVDYAINDPIPISPQKSPIFLGALIVSFLIPFSFLYLKKELNTKIKAKDDVQKVLKNLKLVEEIPLFKANKDEKINSGNNYVDNIKLEIFRLIRTKINYLIRLKDDGNSEGKVILVTSSLPMEGKTFIAANLAESFSRLNKKVILIGADLRNPQVHNLYGMDFPKNGLSNYLLGVEKDLEKNILKLPINDNKQLDFLPSGNIPIDPSELTMSNKFEELIKRLKQEYDIIVFDSAPTLLVSDTLNFSPLCDLSLYVVRSNKTEKKILEYIQELTDKKLIINTGIIINGVDYENEVNYGYGYSYNYKG